MSRHKKWIVAGGSILLVLAILAGVFFWYVSDYYRAEDVALEVVLDEKNCKNTISNKITNRVF